MYISLQNSGYISKILPKCTLMYSKFYDIFIEKSFLKNIDPFYLASLIQILSRRQLFFKIEVTFNYTISKML